MDKPILLDNEVAKSDVRDAFSLGTEFSRAICKTMPNLKELFDLLESLVGKSTCVSSEPNAL